MLNVERPTRIVLQNSVFCISSLNQARSMIIWHARLPRHCWIYFMYLSWKEPRENIWKGEAHSKHIFAHHIQKNQSDVLLPVESGGYILWFPINVRGEIDTSTTSQPARLFSINILGLFKKIYLELQIDILHLNRQAIHTLLTSTYRWTCKGENPRLTDGHISATRVFTFLSLTTSNRLSLDL